MSEHERAGFRGLSGAIILGCVMAIAGCGLGAPARHPVGPADPRRVNPKCSVLIGESTPTHWRQVGHDSKVAEGKRVTAVREGDAVTITVNGLPPSAPITEKDAIDAFAASCHRVPEAARCPDGTIRLLVVIRAYKHPDGAPWYLVLDRFPSSGPANATALARAVSAADLLKCA